MIDIGENESKCENYLAYRGGGAFWNMGGGGGGGLIVHKVKHIPLVYSSFPKCLLHCLFERTNFFAISTVSNVSVIDL